ncbi:MAG: hypothetical protein PHE17_18180 [Thiothrix sp.]|uniref:hypothetical protein n=1 Tax=Thiothrix sp. TaxID=1032 RepID=UPI002636378C|nr:hypothetical protein [Thiothrix sp.]MDD5394950.1 hypothetical protein [Thiothrix sp.]
MKTLLLKTLDLCRIIGMIPYTLAVVIVAVCGYAWATRGGFYRYNYWGERKKRWTLKNIFRAA